MIKSSFEKYWRKVFAHASQQPPSSVWRAIESGLDSEDKLESKFSESLNKASLYPPDDLWESLTDALEEPITFEDALKEELENMSTKPSEEVWGNISEQLGKEDERKPIILWLTKPWVSIALAAALMVAILLPFFLSDTEIKPVVSQNMKKSIKENTYSKAESPQPSQQLKLTSKDSLTDNLSESLVSSSGESVIVSFRNKSPFETETSQRPALKNTVSDATIAERESKVAGHKASLQESIQAITKKSFKPYGNSFVLKRAKLESPQTQGARDSYDRKSWIGLLSGLAPFNPNIQINNFEREAIASAQRAPAALFSYTSLVDTPTSSDEAFEVPLSRPFNEVREGNSINLGLDYGFDIGKRISLGVGARYVRGISFIESNVYNYNLATGDVLSFLNSYYIQNQRSELNNTVISSSQTTENSYQYLIIPVQLGTRVALFPKLDAGVSAGLSGDFLINNILRSGPDNRSRLNAQNSTYKLANLSGVAGLSLNYHIASQWEATFGGNYQRALTSGASQSESFTFVPTFIGVNYGLRYILK